MCSLIKKKYLHSYSPECCITFNSKINRIKLSQDIIIIPKFCYVNFFYFYN